MNRPAHRRGSLWRALRDIAVPVRGIPRSNVIGAVRFAVIWFTALALILQTTLATVSMAANASQPNALGLSAICDSVDQQSPSASHDQVAGCHLKCIACVIGHSLAPPLLSVQPALRLVGFSDAAPFSVPAPYVAPYYSHSARGPPATA